MTIALESSSTAVRRNEHMTFRANMGVGRHGWLRLTPAYGVRLVRERIAHLPNGSIVFDPFSGTGTTALAAAELGFLGQAIDVNPFLVWLGNTKTANYAPETIDETKETGRLIVSDASQFKDSSSLWQPSLFKIEKWWSPGTLHSLKVLRSLIDTTSGSTRDLLEIALCRTLIASSNAAFNHQSMSFRDTKDELTLFEMSDIDLTLRAFQKNLDTVLDPARFDLVGTSSVRLGDSRTASASLAVADFIITSPPYVNRMSYIRELRPYMYWLRYLHNGSDAGDLDWQAIGGTWGTATSKLNSWTASVETPVDADLMSVCTAIRKDGGKNGPLLATYVAKYHHDMWLHFQSATKHLTSGGSLSYIIGNSTFYGHEVPAQKWFAAMLKALDYRQIAITVIRKRNSNRALFEYEVTAERG